jgi:hypothetical protein
LSRVKINCKTGSCFEDRGFIDGHDNNNEMDKGEFKALVNVFLDGANNETYGCTEDLQFIIRNEYNRIRKLIFATQK